MGSYVHRKDSTQAPGDPSYRTGLLAEQWVLIFQLVLAGIQTHTTDKRFLDRLNVKSRSKLMEQAEQRLAWLGLRQWQGDGEESSHIMSQQVEFMESCVQEVESLGPHVGQIELERLENQDGEELNRRN